MRRRLCGPRQPGCACEAAPHLGVLTRPKSQSWVGSMRVAALFYVDGTLLARNSATLYMRHLRRTGQATRRDVAWTLYYLLRYKFGLLDIDGTVGESMRFVRGKAE